MLLILLIVVLVLVFGGGGGYLRISEMGHGRRCRDWRLDPDYRVGFVPIRRTASVT
jgi:hypothetical protein